MNNSDRPLVGLDIDGVFADFAGRYLEEIEHRFGLKIPVEQITTWEIADSLPEDQRAEMRTAVFKAIGEPGFCASIKPYPGSREGLERLESIADVVFVTSPWHGPTWAFERAEWIRKHLGVSDAPNRCISAHLKFLVTLDFLVDDKPSHCRQWRRTHWDGTPLLWHHPSNSKEDMQNIQRVYNWDDVHHIVENYIEAQRSRKLRVSRVLRDW